MRKFLSLVGLLFVSISLSAQSIVPISSVKQTNLDSLSRWYNGSPRANAFSSAYRDTVTVIGQVVWAASQSNNVTMGNDQSRALIYLVDTARVNGNRLPDFGAVQVFDQVGAAGSRDSSLFQVTRGSVIKLTGRVRSAFGSPLGYHHTVQIDKINGTPLTLDDPLTNPLPLPDTVEIPLDSLFYADGNMDLRAEKYDGMIVRIKASTPGELRAFVTSRTLQSNGRYLDWFITKNKPSSTSGVLALRIGEEGVNFSGSANGGVADSLVVQLPQNGAFVESITGVLSKVRSNGAIVVDSWSPAPSGARGRTWRLHPFQASDIKLATQQPPVITSSTRSATIPTPNTPVTITTRAATIVAPDTVSSVALFYNTTTTIPNRNFAGPYTQVNATRSAANDSIWTANIPGFAAGTFVNYFVRATSSTGLSLLDIDTSTFKNFYRVGASPSVFDVQFSPYGNTATSDVVSPLANQTITVRGVVTADSIDNLVETPTNAPRAIHIQDGTGLWSGVRVVVDNYTVASGTILKGDSVTVTGIVRESFNYTQIDARSSASGSVTKIGTATSPISPLQLTTSVLASQSEAYEGMLVQVNNVGATRSNLAGFEFAVRERNLSSGPDYLVDDLSGWPYRGGNTGGTFNPINPGADTIIANRSSFASLRGIHFFSFSAYKLTPPRANGFTGYQLNANEKGNPLPTKFALAQNYPNPFNPTTTIRYDLSARTNVKLKVYDVIGREVATLVNANQGQGAYQVPFNASALASGVYFYRLEAGSYVETKKMLLIK